MELSFALVYPDKSGANVVRQVARVHSQRQGPDDRKTLEEIRLQIGDCLSIAIHHLK